MNWINANKFLAGFIAAMVVGVALFGFLLFSAKARHDEVTAQYGTQSSELNRLLGLAPYPDAKNLQALTAQRKEHLEAITALQKNLAANELPIEPLTPQQFQDRLRESVSRVVAKAGEKTKLPEKFYMGFEPYQTEPPRPEAAPLLGRDLNAIEWVVNQLLENNVEAISKLERQPIPQEGGAANPEEDDRGSRGGRGDRDSSGQLVTTHPFTIEFVAEFPAFQTALNNITSSRAQFFIPRLVQVKNQAERGPSRTPAIAAATGPVVSSEDALAAQDEGATPPPAAAPGAPPAAAPQPPAATPQAPAAPAQDLEYIVGDERLEASMVIEIVDFADPEASTADAK